MTTKAELEKENELLREVAGHGTMIKDCHLTGSATDAQCEAVKEIAIALQYAAKALNGTPLIQIGDNTGGSD